MTTPRYSEIEVELTGSDGNAFAVVAKVMHALRRNGVSIEERDEFVDEAMSGDYDHLLRTAMAWVEVS